MNLTEVVYLGVIWYVWGKKIVLFAVVFWVAFSVPFEVINYVSYYGLRRKEIALGKYERINMRHSWNSSHSLKRA